LPRCSAWLLVLAAACAQAPQQPERPQPAPPPAPSALPATYVNDPDCPGCLAVTVTLRPDGAFLLRDRLGESEFYDFGAWRYADGTLELAGGRDTRRYRLAAFRRAPQLERLRGPFRMVGLYDGALFKECRTGVAWRLDDTRAAQTLRDELVKAQGRAALVALDAQLEGAPEMLRVFRPAAVLEEGSCPR
jgi:hypothetical protein